MNNIVLTAVIIIILIAHLAIYLWVRFKVDEGVILKHLQDQEAQSNTIEAVASATGIKPKRLAGICRRSQGLGRTESGDVTLISE
ncbi:MAG: hypothetical protein ACR2QG_02760 [Gammaproteobacteria bacterium]